MQSQIHIFIFISHYDIIFIIFKGMLMWVTENETLVVKVYQIEIQKEKKTLCIISFN